MNGALRVFAAEGVRLLHSRSLLLSTIGVAAIAALRVKGAQAIEITMRNAAAQRALARGAEPPADLGPGNAFAPWAEGWVTGVTLGTLLLLVLAARTLAGDRETGLLRVSVTRSVTRGGLVLGRGLLGVPLCTGLLVVTGAASWWAANGLFTFGPLVEHGYEILTEAELWSEASRAALATIGPLFATWCFGLLISSICRTPSVAVGAALSAWLGFDLFKQVLRDDQYWFFAAFNPSLVDGSALNEFVGVSQGLSDAGYSEVLYNMNLSLPVPEALLMLALAWLFTARRSL